MFTVKELELYLILFLSQLTALCYGPPQLLFGPILAGETST